MRRLALVLALLLPMYGCPAADDDDATGDDDDATGDDDDATGDDDDATGDDDDATGDDDDATGDDDDSAGDDDDSAGDDDDSAGDDDDSAGDDDDSAGDDDDDSAAVSLCTSATTAAQGMDFVCIDGGTFDMGCTPGQESQVPSMCVPAETPVHSVTLTNALWVATTEVTTAVWTALVGNDPSPWTSCGTDCPVISLSWWEAAGFANAVSTAEGLPSCYTLSGCSGALGDGMVCTSVAITASSGSPYDCVGYRLPTEAEFEYAARGGQDLAYAGSAVIEDTAWYALNSGGEPHPVAGKMVNGYGLYDLVGNAVEYTNDWYDAAWYAGSPGVNPVGPPAGPNRAFRGGSWGTLASQMRCSARMAGTGDNTTWLDTGMRLVRTAQ